MLNKVSNFCKENGEAISNFILLTAAFLLIELTILAPFALILAFRKAWIC